MVLLSFLIDSDPKEQIRDRQNSLVLAFTNYYIFPLSWHILVCIESMIYKILGNEMVFKTVSLVWSHSWWWWIVQDMRYWGFWWWFIPFVWLYKEWQVVFVRWSLLERDAEGRGLRAEILSKCLDKLRFNCWAVAWLSLSPLE